MNNKTVAVVGASNSRAKFGNKAVRAFQEQGYRVVPINPREREVEGLRAYPSVLDVPFEIDMATFYVPAEIGVHVLEQVAERRIPEIWLNPGSESDELLARAETLGLTPILACSIMGIGASPSAY